MMRSVYLFNGLNLGSTLVHGSRFRCWNFNCWCGRGVVFADYMYPYAPTVVVQIFNLSRYNVQDVACHLPLLHIGTLSLDNPSPRRSWRPYSPFEEA